MGIPHPPGTPLFIMVGRVWALCWNGLTSGAFGPAVTNTLSAAATAAGCAALGLLLARATGARLEAYAAAVCAGMASTVWLNATETEVYSVSLLLSALMLLAAWRAGATEDGHTRWTALTAYLVALAVPLHLSALVAAPAALVLVTESRGAARRWEEGAIVAVVLLLSAAVGTASGVLLALAAAAAAVMVVIVRRERRPLAIGALALAVVAFSALAIIPLRAMHEPGINEGYAVTLSAVRDVVGRRQYDVAGIWPRQAPLWLQAGNFFEYTDWQFALGLSPGVGPSWLRTPVTVVYALLGLAGFLAHRRRDRRSWRALAVLLLGATAGLVVYLNFKAGASFGYGILPDSAPHEARDRDYFFALAFWLWGAWAGWGAVALARGLGRRWLPVGVCVALLPAALNWRAVDRRREPEASLPARVAEALLISAPPRAVLVTDGDNDSFPLWYAQEAEGVRKDVTVVVTPLLPAQWYRGQLARRDSLLSAELVDGWAGESGTLRGIGRAARVHGRPIVAAITAGSAVRREIGGAWVLRGWGFVQTDSALGAPNRVVGEAVDTSATALLLRRFGPLPPPPAEESSVDEAALFMAHILACPARALAAARRGTDDERPAAARSGNSAAGVPRSASAAAPDDSLDSRCNLP